jgi:hypothetical protein
MVARVVDLKGEQDAFDDDQDLPAAAQGAERTI